MLNCVRLLKIKIGLILILAVMINFILKLLPSNKLTFSISSLFILGCAYIDQIKFINFVELVLVELNLSVNLLMLVHHLKIQGYLG